MGSYLWGFWYFAAKPNKGAGSLLLDDLAETAPLEMKFKAVTRATPPTVAEPSIVARVSDFCKDSAPTTPAELVWPSRCSSACA